MPLLRPEVPRANARSIRHGFVSADWQPVTPRRPAQGTAKRCCHHECARARIGRPQARQDPTLEPPWRPRVRIKRQRVRQIWRLRARQNLTLKDSDLPGWQRRDASAALQAARSARAHAQLPMSRTQHARSVPRSCRRLPRAASARCSPRMQRTVRHHHHHDGRADGAWPRSGLNTTQLPSIRCSSCSAPTMGNHVPMILNPMSVRSILIKKLGTASEGVCVHLLQNQ